MKNLILGAAVAALLAACGGGGKPTLIDANGDAVGVCNPVAQTGCKTGEKCTWIVDVDSTMQQAALGHTGCAAISGGAVADGGACSDAEARTGGIDNCVAGDVCIAGKCKPICDPQVAGNTATGACAVNYACATYESVFESGGLFTAGACDPACNPLTQQLKVGTDHIDACGSATATAPTSTCVFGPSTEWLCAPTDSTFYTRTDRAEPERNRAGQPYINGCAPGFVPLFFEDGSGARKVVCTGTCAPVTVDSMVAQTKPLANQGDPEALAKLPTEAAPLPGNAVCVDGKKGSAVAEDCRYSWWVLFGRLADVEPSPYNDTLGFCFAYGKFFEPNTTTPLKSCAELLRPADANPANQFTNAALQGCYSTTAAKGVAAADPTARTLPPIARLPYGSALLTRHVFD